MDNKSRSDNDHICRYSQCGEAHVKILQNSPCRRRAIAGSGYFPIPEDKSC